MNTLVTGGLGFIGSNLVDQLVRDGHKVIVIDNLITGSIHNKNSDCIFHECNLEAFNEVDFVKRLLIENNIDTVFHLAALPNVQMSMDQFSLTHENTLSSTVHLLDAIAGTNVKKFVFSSTSAVYGDTNEFPTTENAKIDLITPYALQKFTCEKYLEIFSKIHDISITCLRYFNVYGERMAFNGPYSLVLCRFLKQIAEGQELTVTNDGEQRRDFIYVGDIIQANILASQHLNENKIEVFNVGYGQNFSINEIADAMGGSKVYIGERIEPRVTLCSNAKIKDILGWKPTVSVLDWIKTQL